MGERLTAEEEHDDLEIPGPRVRQRRHQSPRRDRRVQMRFDDDEHDLVATHARKCGLTVAGFAAEAALQIARGSEAPGNTAMGVVLEELMLLRAQVRRYGTNVNQAVAQLHATGSAPLWLEQAVARTDGAVERIDEVTLLVAESLRRKR